MLSVSVNILIFACMMLAEKQAATHEHGECFEQIVYCLEKLAGRTVI